LYVSLPWPFDDSLFNICAVKSFTNYDDAVAFVSGRDPPPDATGDKPKPTRFYGVAVGRKPGVYTDWDQASDAIRGSKAPKYKKFYTLQEAEAFVQSGGRAPQPPAPQPPASQPPTVDGEEGDGSGEGGDRIAEPPTKKKKPTKPPTIIYTDGSSLGNGRAGAVGGVGVYFGESDPRFVWLRMLCCRLWQCADP
jgi:ribonuclease HI